MSWLDDLLGRARTALSPDTETRQFQAVWLDPGNLYANRHSYVWRDTVTGQDYDKVESLDSPGSYPNGTIVTAVHRIEKPSSVGNAWNKDAEFIKSSTGDIVRKRVSAFDLNK